MAIKKRVSQKLPPQVPVVRGDQEHDVPEGVVGMQQFTVHMLQENTHTQVSDCNTISPSARAHTGLTGMCDQVPGRSTGAGCWC